jgi:hypothetical protein
VALGSKSVAYPVLKWLRMPDLACGSGAFLIEAFDQLHALYEISNARLEKLRGQRTLFDLDRQILQHNLYGVDLNAEAIQTCQLSLWIKTAARGKRLTSLDHTIREGNSIISDKAVHPKAFAWQVAFPEIFAQGGFNVMKLFSYPPMNCKEPDSHRKTVPETMPAPRALGQLGDAAGGGYMHPPPSPMRPTAIPGSRHMQHVR